MVIALVAFDRTHIIHVFCFSVPRVVIADARSLQALAAILHWPTHLAAMPCWYRSDARQDEFRPSQAAFCEFEKYEVEVSVIQTFSQSVWQSVVCQSYNQPVSPSVILSYSYPALVYLVVVQPAYQIVSQWVGNLFMFSHLYLPTNNVPVRRAFGQPLILTSYSSLRSFSCQLPSLPIRSESWIFSQSASRSDEQLTLEMSGPASLSFYSGNLTTCLITYFRAVS